MLSRSDKSPPPLCISILEVPRDQSVTWETQLSAGSCAPYEAANPVPSPKGETLPRPCSDCRARLGKGSAAPATLSEPTRERTKGIVLKQVHMFLTSFRLAIGHSHTTASCKGLFSQKQHSFASWQNNRQRALPLQGPRGPQLRYVPLAFVLKFRYQLHSQHGPDAPLR